MHFREEQECRESKCEDHNTPHLSFQQLSEMDVKKLHERTYNICIIFNF